MKTSRTSDVQFILFFFFFNWMSSKIYNDIMKIFYFFSRRGPKELLTWNDVLCVHVRHTLAEVKYKYKNMKKVSVRPDFPSVRLRRAMIVHIYIYYSSTCIMYNVCIMCISTYTQQMRTKDGTT